MLFGCLCRGGGQSVIMAARIRQSPSGQEQSMARSVQQQQEFSASSARPRSGFWLRMVGALLLYRQNARTRRQLAQLDQRQLADIGISQSERLTELDKPFWRN
jgi:uncharacterized protein YjiS (DUF1127 family)